MAKGKFKNWLKENKGTIIGSALGPVGFMIGRGADQKRAGKKDLDESLSRQQTEISKRREMSEAAGEKVEAAFQDTPKYDFQLAPEIEQALDIYKQTSVEDLPGLDMYKQDIGSQTASAVRDVRDIGGGTSGLSVLSDIYRNQNQTLRELNIAASNYRAARSQQQRDQYASALGQVGQMRQQGQLQEFMYNEYQPKAEYRSYLQGKEARLDPYAQQMGLYGDYAGLALMNINKGQQLQNQGVNLAGDALSALTGIPFGGITNQLTQGNQSSYGMAMNSPATQNYLR